MTAAELRAKLEELFTAIKRRSTSPTVDLWCDEGLALGPELETLTPTIVERRAGFDRRTTEPKDGEQMPRRRGGLARRRKRPGSDIPQRPLVLAVTVGDPPLSSLTAGGDTHTFTESITYSEAVEPDAVSYPVTWASSDTGVASFADSSVGTITPHANGVTNITCTVQGVRSAIYVLTVSSTPAVATVVEIPEGLSFTLAIGAAQTVTPRTRDQFGVLMTSRTYGYASSNTAVATASGGTITGVAGGGPVTITVTDTTGGATSPVVTIAITVTATPQATTVLPSPSVVGLTVGSAGPTVTATTLDQSGAPMSGQVYDFTSSASGLATIHTSTGTTAGIAAGTGSFTVRNITQATPRPSATVPFTVSAAGGAGTAPSPTGQDPPLGWTTAWQYVWEANRTAYLSNPTSTHAARIYGNVLDTANRAGTPTPRYGEKGYAPAMMYQLTGDPTWAQLAYSKVQSFMNQSNQLSGIEYQNKAVQFPFIASLIYNNMTTAQKAAYWARLEQIITSIRAQAQRLSDTDMTVGVYMFFAVLHYWNVPENPYYGTALDTVRLGTGTGPGSSLGGVDATAANKTSTLRNALKHYIVNLGYGGEWPVGNQYAFHEVSQILLFPLWQIRKINPTFLPEIDAWLDASAVAMGNQLYDSYLQPLQWGSDQDGHHYDRFDYYMLFASRANMCTGQAKLWAQKALNEYYTVKGAAVLTNAGNFPIQEAFIINATATAETDPWPYESTVTGYYAASAGTAPITGVGNLVVRGPDMSVLMATQPSMDSLDHSLKITSEMTAWRGTGGTATRWLDHPVGYNADPLGFSGAFEFAGLDAMKDKAIVRTESGADWWSLTASHSGLPYSDGRTNPPAFVTRHDNRIMYLREDGWDCVIQWNDIDAVSPLPNLSAYIQNASYQHQAAITAALTETGGAIPRYLIWVNNAATSLTVAADKVTYTQNGWDVEVRVLLPAAPLFSAILDSGPLLAPKTYGAAEENGYKCIRMWNSVVDTTADKYLTIWMCGTGTPPASSVVGNVLTLGARTITFGASSITVA